MCGIAGFYDPSLSVVEAETLSRKLNDSMLHRGPDGGSVHVALPWGFCHRRLSIIDLNEHSNQPFFYQDLILVYNGEVYNYLEIKAELINLGFDFTTSSDTEVICAAYKAWGEDCVTKFVGMWAFALHDTKTGELFCSRDRFGIKPFYYIDKGHSLYYASEIKTLKHCPTFNSQLNMEQVSKGLQLGYSKYKNQTYYECITELPAAHSMVLSNKGLKIYKYWELGDVTPQKISIGEAQSVFHDKFFESIKLHMRSDVEVGACVSGGLDSSAIVSSIGSTFPEKALKMFTIYYSGANDVDERPFVRTLVDKYPQLLPFYKEPNEDEIAAHFHHFLYHQDIPVAGSSPISQYFLMQLAAQQGVKVVLDGQGSDEYLGGYMHSLYRLLADNIAHAQFGSALQEIMRYHRFNSSGLQQTLKTTALGFYAIWNDEQKLLNTEYHKKFPLLYDNADWMKEKGHFKSHLSNALYSQLFTSSLPTLLHFEDRNSMAFSIESRVPFLDHRLVEYAFQLPGNLKIDKGITKKVLREALKPYLPKPIYERTDKKGFVTPGEVKWLKGPLSFLLALPLNLPASIDKKKSQALIENYKKGDLKYAKLVWRILVLNYWINKI